MVKSLDSLPEDVYSLLQGKQLVDESVFDEYGQELSGVLLKSFKKEDSRTLRMSNIGRPNRQLYYEMTGVPSEPIEGKALFKFAYGHVLESLVICLAKAAGHQVERQQEEVNVDGILGHIDGVVNGVLVDVKSCSPFSFNKFVDGSLLEEGNDPFGYVGQLAGYAHALNLSAAWIAIDKVSGGICVLKLPQERIDAYDVRGRIAEVRQVTSGRNEPEQCYPDEADGKSGNRKLGVGCSYCAYKFHCWRECNDGQGLRTYYYANGPRYLTVVRKEPRVNNLDQFETRE